MRLDEIGIWITPYGERVDVYESRHLTHESYAIAHGTSLSSMVKKGNIRVSTGTTFHFQKIGERVLAQIRLLIKDHRDLYEGRMLTLINGDEQEWDIPVDAVMDEEFELMD